MLAQCSVIMRNLYGQFRRDAYEANRRYPHPSYPHYRHRHGAWMDILNRARTLPVRRYSTRVHAGMPYDIRRRIRSYY